jgi:glyoxylase-like metal-dependent hydrolase (beta-lactamase superfamily II)
MRPIDVLHLGIPKVICCWEHEGVLVDPGPESCVETLLEALGGERPRAILLTHIHFDHAGASGALVRRWPDLEVHVHARGARHLADPSRLVASAARLYGGEEGLRRLWGEVVPVPQANLRVLEGGETGILDAYRVAYAPGHASHHVAYLHEPTGTALVGDVGGVRIPPCDAVVMPTPPPDIDVAAWERSLDTLASWAPERLGITHWGEVADVGPHLESCRARLHEQALLITQHGKDAFMAAIRDRIAAACPAELTEAYEEAAPPEHLWLGLNRWRERSLAA